MSTRIPVQEIPDQSDRKIALSVSRPVAPKPKLEDFVLPLKQFALPKEEPVRRKASVVPTQKPDALGVKPVTPAEPKPEPAQTPVSPVKKLAVPAEPSPTKPAASIVPLPTPPPKPGKKVRLKPVVTKNDASQRFLSLLARWQEANVVRLKDTDKNGLRLAGWAVRLWNDTAPENRRKILDRLLAEPKSHARPKTKSFAAPAPALTKPEISAPSLDPDCELINGPKEFYESLLRHTLESLGAPERVIPEYQKEDIRRFIELSAADGFRSLGVSPNHIFGRARINFSQILGYRNYLEEVRGYLEEVEVLAALGWREEDWASAEYFEVLRELPVAEFLLHLPEGEFLSEGLVGELVVFDNGPRTARVWLTEGHINLARLLFRYPLQNISFMRLKEFFRYARENTPTF